MHADKAFFRSSGSPISDLKHLSGSDIAKTCEDRAGRPGESP